jgi:hypothetical protein
MTNQINSEIPSYGMHPVIEEAYNQVHIKLNSSSKTRAYQNYDHKKYAKDALSRSTLSLAAFNFHYYFPTHFMKVCHTLHSERIIGFDKLATWLTHNPYITVIDVGCGDGAGSVAVIDTILRLRERGLVDPRSIQIFCVGVDPNPNGLLIFERMLEEVSKFSNNLNVQVDYSVVPASVSQASNEV